MTTIAQRELRNNVSEILRRAEAGEQFTVTVNGRAVATVGPPGRSSFGTPQQFLDIFERSPVDPGFADDIARMRREDDEVSVDPWA